MKIHEIAIIGGGPAGLFAGIHCPPGTAILLERNPSAGKKLLISGSGRCNITHNEDIRSFFSRYGDKERFARQALMAYTNLRLMDFFTQNGLPLYTDKNLKVFPESNDAADVLKTLLAACRRNNTTIGYNRRITDVSYANGLFHINTASGLVRSNYLVIATGGLSYPSTGSTGDGYAIARSLGHNVTEPKPALSPVFIKNYSLAELAGVSLTGVSYSVFRNNKKVHDFRGDIGFTHRGISGPGILDYSRFIRDRDTLKFNFADIGESHFRQVIIDGGRNQGKTALSTFLKQFELPRNLLRKLLGSAAIPETTLLAEITREQRIVLTEHFCAFPLVVEKVGGFKVAMVTAGGVSLDEISSKTLESKRVPGLYFCGEVLDIDGDTGGYNLQMAFSTGYIAAMAMRAKLGL